MPCLVIEVTLTNNVNTLKLHISVLEMILPVIITGQILYSCRKVWIRDDKSAHAKN